MKTLAISSLASQTQRTPALAEPPETRSPHEISSTSYVPQNAPRMRVKLVPYLIMHKLHNQLYPIVTDKISNAY